MDERLKRLIARRNQAAEERKRLLESRKAIADLAAEEAREDLSPEEDAEFRSISEKVKAHDEDIAGLDERIAELTAEAERDAKISEGAAAVRRAQARITAVGEAATYVKGNGRSYLQDLVRVQLNMDGSGESRARLERHAIDVRTAPEYRDLDRVDTNGGYFVAPAWLMAEYEALARAGRVTANLVRKEQLPAGTDSINVPKIATGTATGVQQADNSATGIGDTDLVDTVVTCGVKTIAGQQDVAIQLLDQSPVAFDQIIFGDLLADYASQVDKQVIAGSNANGQVKGILSTASPVSVTYTDTAPTVGALYGALADGVQQIHTARFLPPTAIVMHPRRWGWIQSARDEDGRPLVAASGPGVNQIATAAGVVSEGLVGNLLGLPVYVDPNLPINLGTGTNEDRILILRASDSVLYESSIRSRVLPDVGSGTLTVRLQVYGYVAFTSERQNKGVGIVAGTGLVTPAFS